MIHIEFIPSTLLGIGLTSIGFFLFIIRTKNPLLSREYDIFFSSAGFLSGGILIFEGWRLDPILLLCQILSSIIAISFIVESLLLRRYIHKKSQSLLLNLKKNKISKEIVYKKKYSVYYPKAIQKYKKFKLLTGYKNLIYDLNNYTIPIEYIKVTKHYYYN